MKIIEVVSIEDAQIVRIIRNQIKDTLTNNRNHIYSSEQDEWFSKHLNSGNRLFLYLDEHISPMGYGYVLYRDNKAWLTLGVMKDQQNKGYGTKIYEHLKSLNSESYLEIFGDNTGSLIAALKNGFEIVAVNDKITTLRYRKEKN